MENLEKQLKKFSPKERFEIESIIEKIFKRELAGFNCKKLKGLKNLFLIP